MSARIIPFPDVDELHDRFILAARAFRAEPCPETARACADAYRAFYRVFTRSRDGLDVAMAELWQSMNQTMLRAMVG